MQSDERIRPADHEHLSEDQLVELYVCRRDVGSVASCPACQLRFADLLSGLADMQRAAADEADALFSSERLQGQHERILRRLERHGQPAQVVTFPAHGTSQHPRRRAPGSARRWIAAAAAAGLVAGLLLGHFVDADALLFRRAPSQSAPGLTAVAISQLNSTAEAADDQLLVEIEDALASRDAVELSMLDALTTPPELQEIVFDTR